MKTKQNATWYKASRFCKQAENYYEVKTNAWSYDTHALIIISIYYSFCIPIRQIFIVRFSEQTMVSYIDILKSFLVI